MRYNWIKTSLEDEVGNATPNNIEEDEELSLIEIGEEGVEEDEFFSDEMKGAFFDGA